ncbi:MAG TPA: hypothetical protein VN046_06635 [Stenotrophobium sp.]|jgi:hypothetical protein|nr:hypothetical protein [Stenotrophobium sp.]
MSGALKLVAVLAVILLAGLGVLTVLDIVPRALFQSLALQGLVIAAIVLGTSLVVGLLMKSGSSGKP